MAARPIASGTISFGLVAVPVKLYPATRPKSLSFNMLHKKDKARLRQQYVCSACGEIVDRDDTVRGYEYAKGEYAVLSDEELRALEIKSDQSIEIEQFVPIEKVDPVYFDKAYLLGPDKGGNKPYKLLTAAMRESGKCAVARFSTRGKQQLVLLRQTDRGLMLHTLFYADEVRSFDDVDLGEDVVTKPVEVDLAVKLIDQLATDAFQPELYEDEYRKAALEMIERKIEGKEVVTVPERQPRAQVIDLMEALKQSLAAPKTPKRAPARAASEEAEAPLAAAVAGGDDATPTRAGTRKPPVRAAKSRATSARAARSRRSG
ncbi:MAG TPA: Ku protein [Candidatus Binatia bacterium]